MLTPCSKWLTFQFRSSRFISTSLLCITERSPVSLKTGNPEDPYKRSTVWYIPFSSTKLFKYFSLHFLVLFCHQSTNILNCFFSEPFHLEGQSTLLICEVTFESYPSSGFTTSSFYIFHLLPPDLAHICFHCRNHLPNHF